VKRGRGSGGKLPDDQGVAAAIEGGSIPPVWVWGGPERFRKEELFERLAARVVDPGTAPLNVLRFLGESDGIEAVLTSCQTLPMFGGRRAVLLKNVEKLDRGEREALAGYVEHPAEETALVLTGEANPQRDAWLGRLLEAGAQGAIFWIPFANDAVTWIQGRLAAQGKRCSPDIARSLLAACASAEGERVPLADIAPEIDKVAAAAGDRAEITAQDLAGTARKAHDELLYTVARAVMQRDPARALAALDGALLFKDVNEVRVVATLTFRLLYLLKARNLREARVPAGDPLARRFQASAWGTPWPEIESAAAAWTTPALERGLGRLAEADRAMKSSSRNPRTLLEATIVSLCADTG
jgi:DNA polymerase III delta subunit